MACWRLTPDGAPVRTLSSLLLLVRTADGTPAMLKLALAEEDGVGTPRVVRLRPDGTTRTLLRSSPWSITVSEDGKKVYLCSAACKTQFDANPKKFGY
mgnify:CR=1 FL=1